MHHDHSSTSLPRGGVQPVSGWPLPAFGTLDAASPGFLWQTMQMRPLWRQAVFLAMSAGLMERPVEFLARSIGEVEPDAAWANVLAELAATLRLMKPREVVEGAIGACPDGLLGALDKLGFEPMSPEGYGRLTSFFRNPTARKRRKVVEQIAHLDEDRLLAIEALDEVLLTPTIAMRAGRSRDAVRLNAQVAAARLLCSGVSDQDLRVAIEADNGRLGRDWFSKLLSRRADRLLPLDHPTDGDAEFERVTPFNRRRFGEAFQNCLGRHDMLLGRFLSGTWAMVAWAPAQVLVETTLSTDSSWLLTGLHAHANGRVTRATIERVAARLGPLGVKCFLAAKPPEELAAVRDALGAWDHAMVDVINLG